MPPAFPRPLAICWRYVSSPHGCPRYYRTDDGFFTPREPCTFRASLVDLASELGRICGVRGLGFSTRVTDRLLWAACCSESGPPGPETLKTVPQPPLFVYGQEESVPPQRVVP